VKGKAPPFTRKLLPAMTDDELQQAKAFYGPEHKRTEKIDKEIEKRAGRARSAQAAQEPRKDEPQRIAPATQKSSRPKQGEPGYTIEMAEQDLDTMTSNTGEFGMVMDDRLSERIKRQEKMIAEMKAEAAVAEGQGQQTQGQAPTEEAAPSQQDQEPAKDANPDKDIPPNLESTSEQPDTEPVSQKATEVSPQGIEYGSAMPSPKADSNKPSSTKSDSPDSAKNPSDRPEELIDLRKRMSVLKSLMRCIS
jgi:hypothetical protein